MLTDSNLLKGLDMLNYIMYGLLALVVLAALWAIGSYNFLVRLKALVDEAFSGIDIQYKRRSDLIPNLVETVKGYKIHEKEVLENIAKMRSLATAGGGEQKAQAEAGLTGALKTLFAVSENYPELKANENFLALQKDLGQIETDLQLARRYYNGAARNYNMGIKIFPRNIIATLLSYQPVAYFELTSQADREAPKVSF